MSSYDCHLISELAQKQGFIRDTLEKVIRLVDVLEFINTHPMLKDTLALKGGTAINLTIFSLPRLSIDIDLDYMINSSREEMLEHRDRINHIIHLFMESNGYSRSDKTKNPHSLDSWVYSYIGMSGNKDNIKIEINYSLRSHVLAPEERNLSIELLHGQFKIKTLSALEIYGSKINALLSRAAARDLFDIWNIINQECFDELEKDLLRKIIVFYSLIAGRGVKKEFSTESIETITKQKVKRDLLPVIKRNSGFDLDIVKSEVTTFIKELMTLTDNEEEFLIRFKNGAYHPELLFTDKKILERIKHHPMALWKIRD